MKKITNCRMKSVNIYIFSIFISMILIGCKSQNLDTTVPFDIVEKNYFNWVGGKQGTQGTTIILKGKTSSMNISFSKIYFQNNEYDVVPEFNSYGFEIRGNFSEFRGGDRVMDSDPSAEYGNKAVEEKKIPFDLKDTEAILQYTVNGLEGYHKISDIKKLEKVYMP